MKKVYLETSFVSYLAAKPSRNLVAAAWQEITTTWWERPTMKDKIKDDIIGQVWQAKDDIARECGYDLNKLADLLRKRQDQGRHRVVDYTDHQTARPPART